MFQITWHNTWAWHSGAWLRGPGWAWPGWRSRRGQRSRWRKRSRGSEPQREPRTAGQSAGRVHEQNEGASGRRARRLHGAGWDGLNTGRNVIRTLQWKKDKNVTAFFLWQWSELSSEKRQKSHYFYCMAVIATLLWKKTKIWLHLLYGSDRNSLVKKDRSLTASMLWQYLSQWWRRDMIGTLQWKKTKISLHLFYVSICFNDVGWDRLRLGEQGTCKSVWRQVNGPQWTNIKTGQANLYLILNFLE